MERTPNNCIIVLTSIKRSKILEEYPVCHTKYVWNMVHQTEPRLHISDGFWHWEIQDGMWVFFVRLNTFSCEFKASKFRIILGKYKLIRVDSDTIVSIYFKSFTCLDIALLDIISPEESIIHAHCFLGNIANDYIKSGISISRCNIHACEAVRYQYLPQGVRKIMKCLSSWLIGTLWYPSWRCLEWIS